MINNENNNAAKTMAKEALELLNSRFVVSEANKEIMTVVTRLAEAVAYGSPRTPKRVHHHDAGDPSGLSPAQQQEAERNAVLATLTPSQKRALGFPG